MGDGAQQTPHALTGCGHAATIVKTRLQMTCSQRGSGQTVTTLVIRPDMDCGMKKVDKNKGEAKNDRQVRQQVKNDRLLWSC